MKRIHMEKLAEAVSVDDIAKVTELMRWVDSGAAPLGREFDEPTTTFSAEDLQDAFVQAAFCGSLKSLQALREYVSDINGLGRLRDWYPDYPVSPLRAAVESNSIDCVRWLCSNGADTKYRECVCSLYYSDFISTSCFSNYCSVSCYVPLHFARSSACVETLLEHGAEINAQDCMGKTPLSMATLHGRLDVMATLCKQGADVGLGSIWGATPLVYAQYAASKKDRIAATHILCRYGANVNFQDRNGRSALHVAKDVDCVHILLAYGADPSIETIFGKTPIVTAAEGELWDIVWLIYDAQLQANIGLLSRGVSLFSCIPLDVLTWLLKATNHVRELTHLCRSVIRSQLLQKHNNVDEAIACLPLPPRVKLYIGLWYHIHNNALDIELE